jgi:hypothetical protein
LTPPAPYRGQLRSETWVELCHADKGQAASYGRLRFGALVPVAEHDFGCGDELLGGELA